MHLAPGHLLQSKRICVSADPALTLVAAALAGVIAAAQVLLDTARAELAKRRERLEDLQARMACEPEPPPSETPPKPKQRAPGAHCWDAGIQPFLCCSLLCSWQPRVFKSSMAA